MSHCKMVETKNRESILKQVRQINLVYKTYQAIGVNWCVSNYGWFKHPLAKDLINNSCFATS